jgi:hypothetical protein
MFANPGNSGEPVGSIGSLELLVDASQVSEAVSTNLN